MGLGGAILGGSAISAIGGSRAASARERAAAAAAEQQRAQLGELRDITRPFIEPGQQAIGAQADLLGLGGTGAQQAAIEQIRTSPFFQQQLQESERALLSNAAATGGLRGGNTQRALAELSPNLLNQAVQQQLSNLGGLVGAGLTGAGTFGQTAVPLSSNIASATQAGGAARAQGIGAVTGALGGALGQFGQVGLTNQILGQQGFSPIKVF
jgi:hypothetical protein